MLRVGRGNGWVLVRDQRLWRLLRARARLIVDVTRTPIVVVRVRLGATFAVPLGTTSRAWCRAGSMTCHHSAARADEGAVMAQLPISAPIRRRATTPEPVQRRSWMADAACRGMNPALFFPSDRVGVGAAQPVCRRCGVSAACLDYALERQVVDGVWGGVSERDRRGMLRRASAR